jgi:hypothetical protein
MGVMAPGHIVAVVAFLLPLLLLLENSMASGAGHAVTADFWDQAKRPPHSHAGALQAARERFRHALHASQNPPDCAKAVLCTCSFRIARAGLFAMLHGRAECLMKALVKNCTYVDDADMDVGRKYNDTYFNTGACDLSSVASRWDCYFAPLGTCSTRGAAHSWTISVQQDCNERYGLLDAVAQRFGLPSHLLVNSELMAYVMRPTPRLAATVSQWAAQMGMETAEGMGKCLAVHVRHTDKKGVPKEEKQDTKFVGAAMDLTELFGHNLVNLMTDDPKQVVAVVVVVAAVLVMENEGVTG